MATGSTLPVDGNFPFLANHDRHGRYLVWHFYVNGETSAGFMLALVLDFFLNSPSAWQETDQSDRNVPDETCQEKLF